MFFYLRNLTTVLTTLCVLLLSHFSALAEEHNTSDEPFINPFYNANILPSFSLIAPSGFTPTTTFVSASIGGVLNLPGINSDKGVSSIGIGLALPSNFGFSMNIDMDAPRFSRRQELAISTGKYFSTWDLSMSVGIRNITIWHDDGSQNIPSVYLAASKIFMLEESMLILNGGLGNNDYRVITDTAVSASRAKVASPFLSAAYYFIPEVSIIADNTAGITTLGVGLVPFSSLPLNISLGLYDISKAVPNHSGTSWLGSVSTAVTF